MISFWKTDRWGSRSGRSCIVGSCRVGYQQICGTMSSWHTASRCIRNRSQFWRGTGSKWHLYLNGMPRNPNMLFYKLTRPDIMFWNRLCKTLFLSVVVWKEYWSIDPIFVYTRIRKGLLDIKSWGAAPLVSVSIGSCHKLVLLLANFALYIHCSITLSISARIDNTQEEIEGDGYQTGPFLQLDECNKVQRRMVLSICHSWVNVLSGWELGMEEVNS